MQVTKTAVRCGTCGTQRPGGVAGVVHWILDAALRTQSVYRQPPVQPQHESPAAHGGPTLAAASHPETQTNPLRHPQAHLPAVLPPVPGTWPHPARVQTPPGPV